MCSVSSSGYVSPHVSGIDYFARRIVSEWSQGSEVRAALAGPASFPWERFPLRMRAHSSAERRAQNGRYRSQSG